MVTDRQVRSLMKYLRDGKTLKCSSEKVDVSEKTARKYRDLGRLPSQVKAPHTWRTREDPFDRVWPDVAPLLSDNPGLQAKTLFDWLQREHRGRFDDGQLRTLQRRVKAWRATEGPAQEVMFPQVHVPGRLAQSDFSHMDSLGVTIQGQPFPHLIFHFVLTYSNWETGTVCFSESLESLSEGLQNALWRLGGVPRVHQTDSLSCAVNRLDNPEEFTRRYQGLMSHYKMSAQRTQPRKPNENGDIEQRHHRFKTALDQRLMLRGSRDFDSRKAYEDFLQVLFAELNLGRSKRFQEEAKVLRELPKRRLESYQRLKPRVGPFSTIRVKHNVYSVHSRLIGERVEARIFSEAIEVWYGQKRVEVLDRLRGEGGSKINYRHIIDWLVRKPGAFERYLYRGSLFPTSRFRVAYDMLSEADPSRGHKQYLKILHLAARENETAVDECLRRMIDLEIPIEAKAVEEAVQTEPDLSPPTDAKVEPVNLLEYDQLCAAWTCSAAEWEVQRGVAPRQETAPCL